MLHMNISVIKMQKIISFYSSTTVQLPSVVFKLPQIFLFSEGYGFRPRKKKYLRNYLQKVLGDMKHYHTINEGSLFFNQCSAHHICARTICGRPDWRNTPLISCPLTQPSLSRSALWNMTSQRAFSAALITHGAGGGPWGY